MAQLMRYHRYPVVPVGAREFEVVVEHDSNPYQTYTLLGGDGQGGAYNWGLMPYEPGAATSELERQSIGALCFDAGLSVNMRYGPLGSSADITRVAWALKNVFFFQNVVYGWNNFEFIGAGLLNMLNPNLDAGQPVILVLDGDYGQHAVICDGYGYDNGTMYHHLNLGWGVDYAGDNVWYALPTIDATLTYNTIEGCLYNIFTQGDGEIISGRITDSYGNPIYGTIITATGAGRIYQTIANRLGIYAIKNVASDATFSIMPYKNGYSFTQRTITTGKSLDNQNTAGNRCEVDFIGSGPPFEPITYPLMGKFDSTNYCSLILYNDFNTNWLIKISTGVTSNISFGVQGCQPVFADFDGDKKGDPGLYAEQYGIWGVKLSTKNYALTLFSFGAENAHPVAADFDGYNRADPTLYIPAEGRWMALLSANNYALFSVVLGVNGGRPIAADFDGDGKADPVVCDLATGE